VRWKPPQAFKRISAIAVDNEPEPFWNGDDQEEKVGQWQRKIGFRDEYGQVTSAGQLNGSSGRWVDEHVLAPLALSRAPACITDCLSRYHCSKPLAQRIENTYESFRKTLDLPAANLPSHPDENTIVSAATSERSRLWSELESAKPQIIVTLGNAALRVFAGMIDVADATLPRKLSADESYGRAIQLKVRGASMTWWPLAHPAAPPSYQAAHRRWEQVRGA
jgi:hypothetical protein